jgi:hypothetical protein
MEELCGSKIATCDEQITTDSAIPIMHNLDSNSSDTVESVHESEQILKSDDNIINQPPHGPTPVPSIGTEQERTSSISEKRKRCETSRTELSRNSKKNTTYRKNEIAHTFLNQQQSRNATLDKMADNLQKNPKYGEVQKEVIDKLKTILDPKLPTFYNDYYEMLTILGNDWVRGCFMNETDDMLRGYVDYILRRHRAGLPLVLELGGSVPQYPPPNPAFMSYAYGMANLPSHMLHHVASQSPSSVNTSPVVNLRNMNAPVNVIDDDQATPSPCTPSSNRHPPTSDFYYTWP